jgi:putative ABC transport system permease protein
VFHFDSLRKDLRFAARSFLKNPGFSLVAILALALGIGANSAMFSVVDATLLKPLPYAKPAQLVWLTQNIPMFHTDMATNADYWEWREQRQLFDDVAAYSNSDFNLVGGGEPQKVTAAGVTANFFRTLGLDTSLGRPFTEDEDKPGGTNAVILSRALFAGRFGSNPAILGQAIRLDDKPYTVVGVMPQSFRFPQDREVDLFLPAQLLPGANPGGGWLVVSVIGRVKQGVPLGRVRAELAQARKNSKIGARDAGEIKVVPLHEQVVGDRRTALLVLFGAVGLVLLIACGNVANLLLARAADRRREIALRSALGAARGRLIRQLLTESVLLSLAGAALGLLFARFGIQAVVALGRTQVPFLENTSINPVVLGFTVAAALMTAILFGLAPAVAVSKTDVIEALKQGSQNATAARGQRRFRGLLVASEIAIALVLLTGAGLLIKSLWIMERLDPGFRPDHVLSVDINPIPSRYEKKERALAFFDNVIQRIVALPGVEAVGTYKDRYIGGLFQIPGRPAPTGRGPIGEIYPVSPGLFRALGLHLLRGRFVDEHDGPDAPLVIDINETMARRHFPGEDPIGRQIKVGRVFTIVGVVGDAAQRGPLEEIPALMYEPVAQVTSVPMMHLVVRAAGDPLAIAAVVREQVRAVDRDQPIFNVKTMEEKLAETIAPRRFSMILLAVFAGLALVLAMVGIYAVMYSMVAQRTNEIGIRMALGAGRSDVLRMIVGHGAKLAMLGLAMGMGGAWAATRLLKSMLFNVTPTDPWTFSGVALLLFVVAMGASLLPARRASRVDPIVALREE